MIQHICDRCKKFADLDARSLEIELVRRQRMMLDELDRTVHLCGDCYNRFRWFLDGQPVEQLDEETS